MICMRGEKRKIEDSPQQAAENLRSLRNNYVPHLLAYTVTSHGEYARYLIQ